jgi:glycosyltransferase involved in cell wall biosynthesis
MADYFRQLTELRRSPEFSDQTDTSVSLEHRPDTEIFDHRGLFDIYWYLEQNPDVADAGIDPFSHFLDQGHKEGRRPNEFYDPQWYCCQFADDYDFGTHPLRHYIEFGERNGHKPCLLFDPVWYRKHYEVPADELCLTHYLMHRKSGRHSPNPAFDTEFYLNTYPDIARALRDPLEHYLTDGWREGRNPSTSFDTKFYIRRYLSNQPDINPLEHFLLQKSPDTVCTHPNAEVSVFSEIRRFTQPGPAFEERRAMPPHVVPAAKLLAFYLPQFHQVAENDRWWGRGFTEWTNLARGTPRFEGHYQPRIPRDLGFYDLSSTEILEKQIKIARDAGIFGFVFYFYWFNGHRLLEAPLEKFLSNTDMQMPFALLWTNENWTRRWDGLEADILISQDYRADDEDALLSTWADYFADPRYIRVAGCPLLIIYRPSLIPDTARTIERWRKKLSERHGETPVIFMAQGFGRSDPTEFGLDGALEFPPHKLAQSLPHINDLLSPFDANFKAAVVEYDDLVAASLTEPAGEFPLIKTAVPAWDNDARRQGSDGGMVVHGSTPAKYEAWLSELVARAIKNPVYGEPFVCVNAWNEWAEGAYLEPDLHFGAAYLNATTRALSGLPSTSSMTKILLVGHDAYPHGAQILLLNIGRVMRRGFGMEVEFLLLEGGPLVTQYSDVAPTTVATSERERREKSQELYRRGFQRGVVNTSAAGDMARLLAGIGIVTTVLVHEMPRLLLEKRLLPAMANIAVFAREIFFPAPIVRDKFLALCPELRARPIIMPQGSYSKIEPTADARKQVRSDLGILDDEFVAVGLGYADLRKGFDLFIQIAKTMHMRDPRWHLVWVGHLDSTTTQYLSLDLDNAAERYKLHVIPFTNDVMPYLAAADLYLLTSREDPFPTVVLEALQAGIPAIAFQGSGGMADMITEKNAGTVVELGDVDAVVRAMTSLVEIDPEAKSIRQSRLKGVAAEYEFEPYVSRLLQHTQESLLSISVIVPSFNYARYMHQRLSSVFGQTYPVREIIVLDDASSDKSVEEAHRAAVEWNRDIIIVENDHNSGSPFVQWRNGVERAKGDYVWIAEADDDSDARFLEKLVGQMTGRRDMIMAFTDSISIDSEGRRLGSTYKPYYAETAPGLLEADEIFDAREFVTRALAIRNLILNVSATLWNREALLKGMRRCSEGLKEYKMAGDWHLYVDILLDSEGSVGYSSEPLNMHRRHATSVTHALAAIRHGDEIERVHKFIRHSLGDSQSLMQPQEAYLHKVRGELEHRVERGSDRSPEA